MPDLDRLREGLRDEQAEPRVQRMWREVEAQRQPSLSAQPRPLLWGGALAAAAAVAVLGFLALSEPSQAPQGAGPLTLAQSAPVPSRFTSDSRTAFSDGSMLTTESETRVDTLENSADEVVLALRTGRARFDVEPGGPRSWRIECGALVVEVVGTAFTIDRRRDTVEVEVHRGAVLVRGDRVPDRVQRLERGQSLRVAPPVLEPLAEATPREANQVPPTLEVEAPTTPAPAEAPPERPRGDDPERPAQAPSEPGTGEGGDVDSLLERADVARLSGQPAQAARALERLLDLHPEDPRAALSAFTLAQLRLEQLGQPRSAASAFAHSLSLGLPEGLRETAMARRVEALARAANPGVTIAAAAYLAAYPDGRYREEVRRWSGQ